MSGDGTDVGLSEGEWETLTDACCGAWCNTSRGLHARIMRQVQPAVEAILRTHTRAAVARAAAAEAKIAQAWDEAVGVIAWALDNWPRDEALLYVARNNPHRAAEATTRAPSIGTEPYRGKG